MNRYFESLRKTVPPWERNVMTDGRLLEAYILHRDHAAFGALVQRHGPMIWGVCHRRLGQCADAEDAFQATFLILVRKAASVVPREMVANWLYGVACNVCLKAKASGRKQRERERQMETLPEPEVVAPDLESNLRPLLDQELSKMPDKYRAAIILCDLEGKTRREVARELNLREGTLSSRLTTGRAMLAKRLARHGLAISGATLSVLFSRIVASASVPPAAVSHTMDAARALVTSQTLKASVIPSKVAYLMKGVLKSMMLRKLKAPTAVFLIVLACVCGGLMSFLPSAPGQAPRDSDKKERAKDEKKNATAKGAPDTKNILRNGGFEEGDSTPAHWSQGAEIDGVEYIWDKKIGQKGKASVSLRKTAKRYFPIAQWYQVVDRAETQSAVRVAAQVKADEVTKAIIDVQFLDENEDVMGHKWVAFIGAKQAKDPPVSHDWKEYSGRVEFPKGAKKLLIGLQIYGPGTVWFDEVRAEYEK